MVTIEDKKDIAKRKKVFAERKKAFAKLEKIDNLCVSGARKMSDSEWKKTNDQWHVAFSKWEALSDLDDKLLLESNLKYLKQSLRLRKPKNNKSNKLFQKTTRSLIKDIEVRLKELSSAK